MKKIILLLLLFCTSVVAINSPSYSNRGGTGNRTSFDSAYAPSGLIQAGSGTNLLDGSFAASMYFFNNINPSGKYIRYKFESPKVINEDVWWQNGTGVALGEGWWHWQCGPDTNHLTNVGVPFKLFSKTHSHYTGSNTADTNYALHGNTTGGIIWQMVGDSGTLHWDNYNLEHEFKIDSFSTLGPIITVQPQNTNPLCIGNVASFFITATGTGTLHYAWKRNGSSVGIDSLGYFYTTNSGSGSDTVKVVVTDNLGTATSNTVNTILKSATTAISYLTNPLIISYNTAMTKDSLIATGNAIDSVKSNLYFGLQSTTLGTISGTPNAFVTDTARNIITSYTCGANQLCTLKTFTTKTFKSLPLFSNDTGAAWGEGDFGSYHKNRFYYGWTSSFHPGEVSTGRLTPVYSYTDDSAKTWSTPAAWFPSQMGDLFYHGTIIPYDDTMELFVMSQDLGTERVKCWGKLYNEKTNTFIGDTFFIGYGDISTGSGAQLANGTIMFPTYRDTSGYTDCRIKIMYSTNHCVTWQEKMVYTRSGGYYDAMEPSIKAWGSRVYLTARNGVTPPGKWTYFVSNDTGNTWSGLQQDSSFGLIFGQTAPVIASPKRSALDYWGCGSGDAMIVWSADSGKTLHSLDTRQSLGSVGNIHSLYEQFIDFGVPNKLLCIGSANAGTVGQTGAWKMNYADYLFDPVHISTHNDSISLVIPSYSNIGGAGNRSSIIIVSGRLPIGVGTGSYLVDGLKEKHLYFGKDTSVIGKSIRFNFGDPKVVTQMTWIQQWVSPGKTSQGYWHWRASNDSTNWTNIGSKFLLGNGVHIDSCSYDTNKALATNVNAFQFYEMVGDSFVTSDSAWIYEANFQLDSNRLSKSTVTGFGFTTLGPITSNGSAVNIVTRSDSSLIFTKTSLSSSLGQLKIKNSYGYSDTSTLFIAISISSQPKDTSVVNGSSGSFSVTASSPNPPITYQWQDSVGGGWVNIGTNSPSYSFSATPTLSGRYYRVLINDAIGNITSSKALLTVTNALSIISQMKDTTVNDFSNVGFSDSAYSITGTVTHRLYLQGSLIYTVVGNKMSYSFTASYSQNGDTAIDSISDSNGEKLASTKRRLSVNPISPIITSHPLTSNKPKGSIDTFTVAAYGTGTIHHFWKKKRLSDGGYLTVGGDSAKYITEVTITSDSAAIIYDSLYNSSGYTLSNQVNILFSAAPTITSQPSPTTVIDGNDANFSVSVTSISPPITYQWQDSIGSSWINVGTNSSTLSFTASLSQNGIYYRCVATDINGSTTSNKVLLTVTNSLSLITAFSNFTGTVGISNSISDSVNSIWTVTHRVYIGGIFSYTSTGKKLNYTFTPTYNQNNSIIIDSISDGLENITTSCVMKVIYPNTTIWNSTSSQSWNNLSNWDALRIPLSTDTVVFNELSTVPCTLSTTANIAELRIIPNYIGAFDNKGDSIITSRNININTNGNLTLSGSIKLSGDTLRLLSQGTKTLTGLKVFPQNSNTCLVLGKSSLNYIKFLPGSTYIWDTNDSVAIAAADSAGLSGTVGNLVTWKSRIQGLYYKVWLPLH